MAETTKKTTKTTETVKASPAPVITYTAHEFANSGIFSCPPECVLSAFREAGIKSANVDEAKKLVKSFLSKEVK